MMDKYPTISHCIPIEKVRRHPFFGLAKSSHLAFQAIYLYLSIAFEGVQQSYRQKKVQLSQAEKECQSLIHGK